MSKIQCDGCCNYWHKYLVKETEDGENLCEYCWDMYIQEKEEEEREEKKKNKTK